MRRSRDLLFNTDTRKLELLTTPLNRLGLTLEASCLAEEVRQYFIPDFSRWKEHDAFEAAFTRLLRDLRVEDDRQAARLQTD